MFVLFLPVMSRDISNMAFQFTYSDYFGTEGKAFGECKKGEIISSITLNLPKRPRVDGWKSIFFNNRSCVKKTFSFKSPVNGKILRNDKPYGGESWWYKGERPLPFKNKGISYDAGFTVAILIDNPEEIRGIDIYSEFLFWIRENSAYLDSIAMKSSSYIEGWKEMLDNEIRYLENTISPVIPFEETTYFKCK